MKKGNVLVSVVAMMAVLLTMAVALSAALLSSSIKIQNTYTRLAALSYAEAGINRALFAINQPDNTYVANATNGWVTDTNLKATGDTTAQGQYKVHIYPCGGTDGTSCKQIQAVGAIPNFTNPKAQRTVRIKIVGVNSTSNVSFQYGVQVDNLGTFMSNNSTIKGSIISNGLITMDNNSSIKSNAVSYNSDSTGSWIFGTGGTIWGDAWAQSFFLGPTVKGTKHNNPSSSPLPLTDPYGPTGQVTTWESQAVAGGTFSGNKVVSSNSALGPIKINGDLTVNSQVQLKLTGPVWVTGNVNIGNKAKVYLDPSYGNNSGVIVADHNTNRGDLSYGNIYLDNNAMVYGIDPNNQMTPSYTLFYSSQAQPGWFAQLVLQWTGNATIRLSNGASGGVYYAADGTISIKNGGLPRAVVCGGLTLDQNATINYDPNLANSTFANGPAGTWSITEWQILY